MHAQATGGEPTRCWGSNRKNRPERRCLMRVHSRASPMNPLLTVDNLRIAYPAREGGSTDHAEADGHQPTAHHL